MLKPTTQYGFHELFHKYILYLQEAFDKLLKVYCDKKEFIERQAQEQVE